MATVLVFGADGFVGRHVRVALAGEYAVVCPPRARCDLAVAPVAELVELIRAHRPVAVVNCAGRLGGSDHDLVTAHTLVTAKLVEAVATAAPRARLVRVGSAGEYGVVPTGVAVPETWPAEPVSGYGVSHLAATRLMGLAVTAGRLDGVVLRVFNPIGPGLSPENVLGRAAGLLRSASMRGESEITLGPLDAYRDFVDVRDVASAVAAVVAAPAVPQPVLNVGAGRATRVRAVVRTLAGVAGFTGAVREAAPSGGGRRSAGVPWMRADISAVRRLGWSPSHDLNDTVKAIWAEAAGGS
ncbi:NAD-dependent epimerase/dehydratase family protein [Micromonospora sp. WMMC241]|uniref:NAD-dependent epimerase/dehydratase family protein n=1 Tax=Micromonospora sp. WMMC241 TaxID=3015159 RepID=UPI0022B63C01|nr:NAD-dependent epimerase/dehydratase family protein [Micromonospora sp. WMMC241]MCZ7438581.1 NAD-dependent epimerase/dehydratase family protein [Micromonospora sp. WMMC241]